jgi:hypothetical protein
MPLYRVMVHGEGCRVRLDDQVRMVGFFTTRFREAPDQEMAIQLALESVWAALQDRPLLNAADEPPRLSVDEVEEVERVVGRTDQGFCWYTGQGGAE